MAQFAATAITALTATAAIVGSAGAYRQQEQIYHQWSSEEQSPWHPQQRPPFSSSRSRHTYGYYGQPLYHPLSLHEHYIHHVECPGSQCHYRAFLTDSIQRYNESRRALRQTYIWNLRELSHIHSAQPSKTAADKATEAERLYTYYVSRVRAVFEEHRRDHRRLFGQDYLCWAAPEREDPTLLQGRSRMGSPRIADGNGIAVRDIIRGTPVIEEGREEGTDCEEAGREGAQADKKSKKDGCKDANGKDGKEGGGKIGYRGIMSSRRKNRSKTKSTSAG
ncbi:hypothetical protein F5B19DRAFT_92974 [Rostrohypoxylon terebratum]|nr:hypothetical protein F5B19DRAFT_92974 [Rostrohypoxylon terebratum]